MMRVMMGRGRDVGGGNVHGYFKSIDVVELRCVPANFSSREKNAIKE